MSNNEIKPRRCVFDLFPSDKESDKLASDLIDNERLKERGRLMRALLITGAAFANIDKRLPFLISELATEKTTLQDIQLVIGSVLPESISLATLVDNTELVRSSQYAPSDLSTNRLLTKQETRKNADKLFGDDD